MVGSAIVLDLAQRHQVIATDFSDLALDKFDGVENVATGALDCRDKGAVTAAVADADLVISAVPGFLGFQTLRTLVEAGKKVADISFFPEESLDLDSLAKQTGAVVITDIGVAPGLDGLIFGWHDSQMQVQRFECLVGGLPIQRDMPFQYKAPFSPLDVIEEYLRPARMVHNGQEVVKPALSEPEFVEFEGIGTLEAFNTDGLRSLIRTMPHVPDMVEKTLRYPGHRDLMLALRAAGFLDDKPVDVGGKQVSPRELTSSVLLDSWKLQPGEPELTVMRVTIEGIEDGESVRHVWHLDDRTDQVTGTSSMARTTGYTCTAAAELIIDGSWSQAGVSPGEVVGRVPGLLQRVLDHLSARGVGLKHTS